MFKRHSCRLLASRDLCDRFRRPAIPRSRLASKRDVTRNARAESERTSSIAVVGDEHRPRFPTTTGSLSPVASAADDRPDDERYGHGDRDDRTETEPSLSLAGDSWCHLGSSGVHSVQSFRTMTRAEGAATETVVDTPRGASNRRLRSALVWFGVLVSIVFAYLAIRDVQLGDVWDGLRSSNYLWLLPALAMLAVAVFLKAIRWRYLYARETRPPTAPVVTSTLVGYFFNSILPLRAGEVAKVVALKRRAGTSMAESSATVVIEHAYDVLILLVLLFVTAPWLPEVTWIDTAAALAIALSVVLVVSMIVLAVWRLRPLHFVLRPLARSPFLSAERVEHIGDNLGQGLAALRRPGLVVAAIGLTTLFWLAVAASTWFLMIGFHLDVSFLAALLVVVATSLAMILPLPLRRSEFSKPRCSSPSARTASRTRTHCPSHSSSTRSTSSRGSLRSASAPRTYPHSTFYTCPVGTRVRRRSQRRARLGTVAITRIPLAWTLRAQGWERTGTPITRFVLLERTTR